MNNLKLKIAGRLLILSLIPILYFSCSDKKKTTLPVLGMHDYIEREEGGQKIIDTVWHTIPEFSFWDQDSNKVTKTTFHDNIYIADFFFTTCPTICPTVKGQMLRVYNKYADNDKIKLLSHSIDTRHDSVPVLKDYASKLKIGSDRWQLVTGERDHIYNMARSYFIAAEEDSNAPGGYTHSGGLVLVDPDFRVRGIYDGTDEEAVDELMQDIDLLLKLTDNNE
ncbi:MAG: SCO family protein [Bacteroidota bacterium]